MRCACNVHYQLIDNSVPACRESHCFTHLVFDGDSKILRMPPCIYFYCQCMDYYWISLGPADNGIAGWPPDLNAHGSGPASNGGVKLWRSAWVSACCSAQTCRNASWQRPAGMERAAGARTTTCQLRQTGGLPFRPDTSTTMQSNPERMAFARHANFFVPPYCS